VLTRRGRAAAAVVGLALGGMLLPVQQAAAGPHPACAWPMYGHDPGHSFAATRGCSTLSPLGAATMLPSWLLPTPEPVTATPAVADGTAYVGDWAGTFYAVPTAPPPFGQAVAPRWTFKVDDTAGVAFGRINSSAAMAKVGGRQLVVFAGGATLYVLDAATGRRLTSACLDPRADPMVRCRSSVGQVEIESSPTVLVGDAGRSAQILVGIDVHNDQHVGRTGLISLDLQQPGPATYALTPRWKLDPEAGVAYTGPGLLTEGSGTGQGCGGVWSSPAVDVAKGLVFFGTASCSVDGVTSGESAWAADLATGRVVWLYHPPHSASRWDDDFGASPNLLPGGLVGFPRKDGWYYALRERPSTSRPELVWATPVGEAGHVVTDFAIGGMIGTPAVGLVRGEPAVFATTALSTPLAQPLDDGLALDPALLTDPARLLSLTAVRARDGKVLWRSALPRQSYGAPSYANGVLLVPSTVSFSLDALRADDGLPLAVRLLPGAPSSSAVAVGDEVIIGVGTSETDLEFKAFGGSAFEPLLGSSPIARLSGIAAFRVVLPGPRDRPRPHRR
jgi:outer membrane protein assembly factor BamB